MAKSRIRASRLNKDSNFCICNGLDDGRAMIQCDDCQNWYHFECISLSTREAEDLSVFICSDCHQSTGSSSIRNWETDAPGSVFDAATSSERPHTLEDTIVAEVNPDDESEGLDSEDDYISETDARNRKRPRKNGFLEERKRKARRITSSGSSSEGESDPSPAKKKASSTAKSKAKKAAKAVTAKSPEADPVRKYCIGKLQEVLIPIFLEQSGDSSGDEERTAMQQRGVAFVQELEQCLFQDYSENSTAGPKYKDRFRTMSFNLGKKDRDVLRKRIASGDIPASELAHMSSADLANEQTRNEIEAAGRESLAHSILQKASGPRAKITHKGEELIESAVLDSEEVDRRIKEDEERRNRERQARLRQNAQQAATGQHSPPPSAISPTSNIWPPAVPGVSMMPPAMSPSKLSFDLSPSEAAMMSDGAALDLSDLIDVDGVDDATQSSVNVEQPLSGPTSVHSTVEQTLTSHPTPSPGLRNSSPSLVRKPSFDINSLWSEPPATEGEVAGEEVATSRSPQSPKATPNVEDDIPMDIDVDDVAIDQELDDILASRPREKTSSSKISSDHTTKARSDNLELLPVVWEGTIEMPMEPSEPLGSSMRARQVGGRTLSPGTVWSKLFTSQKPRIDGRVPTDKSAPYLLTTRMNATKELVAVTLECVPGQAAKFNGLVEFLKARDRHAVVMPWGIKPGEDALGKELYLVPLQPFDHLPDYVEMLDNLRIPRERKISVLLGIFVLQRHKFSELLKQHGAQDNTPASATSPEVNTAATEMSNLSSLTAEQLQSLITSLGPTLGNATSTFTPPPPPPIGGVYSNLSQPALPHQHSRYPPPAPPLPPLPHIGSTQYPLATTHPYPSPPEGRRDFREHQPPTTYPRNYYPESEETGRDSRRGSWRDRDHGRNRGHEKPSSPHRERPRDSGWSGRARGRGTMGH